MVEFGGLNASPTTLLDIPIVSIVSIFGLQSRPSSYHLPHTVLRVDCDSKSTNMSLQLQRTDAIVESLTDPNGKAVEIQIRMPDCFVNATRICSSYEKVWANFHSLPTTKQLVSVLERHNGCDIIKVPFLPNNRCFVWSSSSTTGIDRQKGVDQSTPLATDRGLRWSFYPIRYGVPVQRRCDHVQ